MWHIEGAVVIVLTWATLAAVGFAVMALVRQHSQLSTVQCRTWLQRSWQLSVAREMAVRRGRPGLHATGATAHSNATLLYGAAPGPGCTHGVALRSE